MMMTMISDTMLTFGGKHGCCVYHSSIYVDSDAAVGDAGRYVDVVLSGWVGDVRAQLGACSGSSHI